MSIFGAFFIVYRLLFCRVLPVLFVLNVDLLRLMLAFVASKFDISDILYFLSLAGRSCSFFPIYMFLI